MPKYTFHTNHFTHVEGASPGTFRCTSIEVEAAGPETAYNLALPQFPEGSKLFMWHSDEVSPDEEETQST